MLSILETEQRGIARVRNRNTRAIYGTAFLIHPRYVMTCAHVINEAVGSNNETEKPTTQVCIEFPFVQPLVTADATVVEWRPPADSAGSDIAVLELDQEVSLPVLRTASIQPSPGRRIWTKGFPKNIDVGMEAEGVIGTSVEHGRLLIQGHGQEGFFVTGGFSGAPILDRNTGSVLGMAVEEITGGVHRLAFIIPIEQIEQAWPRMARPYKGLNSFQEADARFYYGRERYVQELEEKIKRLSLIAVLGRSGSGKSSLVRAGLIPRLRASGQWRIITCRPGSPTTNPFRNLAAALLDEIHGIPEDEARALDRARVAQDLSERLSRDPSEIVSQLLAISSASDRPEGMQLLLVLDQFEELFTTVLDISNSGSEVRLRSRFVKSLLAATGGPAACPPCRCIIMVRADYTGRVFEIEGLADALKDADVKLGPMNREEVRRAIEEPARSLGVTFDGDFAAELADALVERPDALPLLEFTLAELWASQRNRTLMRPKAPVNAHGSSHKPAAIEVMTAALERHADTTVADLVRRFTEAMVRKVFLDLIWVTDQRRGLGADARRVRFRREFSEKEWSLIESLAGQDRQARIVTIGTVDWGGEATAEIVHDRLIRDWEKLVGWLDEEREFRLWLQKTEELAIEWRQDPDVPLLRGKRLALAKRYEDEHPDAIGSVKDYLGKSIQMHTREIKRRLEGQRNIKVTALASLKNTSRIYLVIAVMSSLFSAFLCLYDRVILDETGLFVLDRKICDCSWLFDIHEWSKPTPFSPIVNLSVGVILSAPAFYFLYLMLSPQRRAKQRAEAEQLQREIKEIDDQIEGFTIVPETTPAALPSPDEGKRILIEGTTLAKTMS